MTKEVGDALGARLPCFLPLLSRGKIRPAMANRWRSRQNMRIIEGQQGFAVNTLSEFRGWKGHGSNPDRGSCG